ncbi:transcriptional regulator [Candidatus Gracilibacteria bacterium CG17_big_fil_post_rev_8_21_14_2_50_48_13]|nr:MAG: transcriptional regulator [Candidatus Gracilibacteria bacterium CG17_big_fil_post_rev_8_21_14_2_50_48_13]
MVSPFPKTTYRANAEVYKVLAHPTRLEILNIMKHEEVSVEDLLRLVAVSKANLSQHLSILRNAGLVHVRRDGLRAFYSIMDARIIEPCRVLHELRTLNSFAAISS